MCIRSVLCLKKKKEKKKKKGKNYGQFVGF